MPNWLEPTLRRLSKMVVASRSQRIRVWLTALLIFLIPSNAFIKWIVPDAYVHGLLVDYLIPKIYLSDGVVMLLLILNFDTIFTPIRNLLSSLAQRPLSIVLSLLAVIALCLHQLMIDKTWISVLYAIKLMEMAGLFLVLNQKTQFYVDKSSKHLILIALTLTLCLQTGLAGFQFFNQRQLAGYWMLGEPLLSSIGIATHSFDGKLTILSYGTTAHPNILAGVAAIYTLLILTLLRSKDQPVTNHLFGSALATLSLGATLAILWWTQSWSGALLLIVGLSLQQALTLWSTKSIAIAASLFALVAAITTPSIMNQLASQFPNHPSITRRVALNQAATRLWLQHPIAGVGLNHFTLQLETAITPGDDVIRFVQPAHHLGLLILSETGLLGMCLLLLLGTHLARRKNGHNLWGTQITIRLAALAPVVVLDHYILTTQTGLLLLILWIGSSSWAGAGRR